MKHEEHKAGKEHEKVNEPEHQADKRAEKQPSPKVSESSAELEKYRLEAVEYKDKYLRALAEFNNMNKRVAKEKEEFVKYAASGLISRMLPVLDNLDMALRSVPAGADKNFVEGVAMIRGNLAEILKKEGLLRIESVGQRFDPLKHEVVGTVDTEDDKEDGLIKEELRCGYALKGLTIRPAMVKVAKKKHEEKKEEQSPAENSMDNVKEEDS